MIQETIPCKFCGRPTTYLGTRQCNDCHEVATRVRSMAVETLKKIFTEERPDVVRIDAPTYWVPYHAARDDFDWDSIHRNDEHHDRVCDLIDGWAWVGIGIVTS